MYQLIYSGTHTNCNRLHFRSDYRIDSQQQLAQFREADFAPMQLFCSACCGWFPATHVEIVRSEGLRIVSGQEQTEIASYLAGQAG